MSLLVIWSILMNTFLDLGSFSRTLFRFFPAGLPKLHSTCPEGSFSPEMFFLNFVQKIPVVLGFCAAKNQIFGKKLQHVVKTAFYVTSGKILMKKKTFTDKLLHKIKMFSEFQRKKCRVLLIFLRQKVKTATGFDVCKRKFWGFIFLVLKHFLGFQKLADCSRSFFRQVC